MIKEGIITLEQIGNRKTGLKQPQLRYLASFHQYILTALILVATIVLIYHHYIKIVPVHKNNQSLLCLYSLYSENIASLHLLPGRINIATLHQNRHPLLGKYSLTTLL